MILSQQNSMRVCDPRPRTDRARAVWSFGLVLAILVLGATARPSIAQETAPVANDAGDAELKEALGNVPAAADAGNEDSSAKPKKPGLDNADVDMLQLLIDGSWPMLPIVFMLLLAMTFTLERFLGLRRSKVMPVELTDAFGVISSSPSGFDPRKAYEVCQEFPCAASNVIRAMLLKIGRPHSEVELAVREANEREAARLYSNVRWLTLAAAVTPLMGLFGTVWGMINAFYATANLPAGASRAEVLADGIVIALVTTLGGLFVAIPAAIAAHYFEGRIQTLFREMDELLFRLLPQVEQYEGKVHVRQEQLHTTGASGESASGESKAKAPAARREPVVEGTRP